MRKLVLFLILALFLGIVGAGFLVTWDMPAPSTAQEKIIPNDRL